MVHLIKYASQVFGGPFGASTGYHSKPERYIQCYITPLKKPLGFKVRSVLKNSGISLRDGH